jgi:peptide/nickel transport system substrate-binding protein
VLLALALFVAAGCSDSDEDEAGAEDEESIDAGEGDDEAEDDEADDGEVGEFPREETLYITGTEWGSYDNWNPLQGGGQATGMMGLMYESLFLFDPHTATLEPWLAESGEWTGDDVYEIRLREGLTWSDGEALDAEDVAFTLDLREIPEVPYSTMANWVDNVEVVDELTVEVTFSDPRKGEWDNWLYDKVILPSHTWGPKAEGGAQVMEEAGDDITIGSGAYLHHSHTQERAAWERNDDWWGIDALGMEMQPRYIVDFRNASNEVVIAQLQQAELDLSNNFLPVDVLDDENIEAYNDEPPYMIPWNVAYLIPNTTVPPLDDAAFRRAMAFAIDVPEIIATAYAGLVSPADPTGLLPTWVDAGMVDEDIASESGFSFDPTQAESLLDDAGYVDGDGDGYRDTPDGEPIELSLAVPSGWTDWNLAAEIMAESLQAVGLNVYADFPEAGTVDDMRTQGDFDLLVNNWTQLQNTPWATYNYLYLLPIQDNQEAQNFARYENEEAWELTQTLGRLAVGDSATEAEFEQTMSQLQQITFDEMPSIPLWYNGAWAQWNTTVWTNWPKGPDGPYPVTWNNLWEVGSIKMLAELEPAN